MSTRSLLLSLDRPRTTFAPYCGGMIGILLLCLVGFGRTAVAQDDHLMRELLANFQQARQSGKYAKMLATAQEMAQLAERSYADRPPIVAACLNALGFSLMNLGQYHEAEQQYERVLALVEQYAGEQSPDMAAIQADLGNVYSALLRYEDAEPHYRRSLAIARRVYPDDDPTVAAYEFNLASLYRDTGRYADAERLYRHSQAVLEANPEANPSWLIKNLSAQGSLYEIQCRFIEAERTYREALRRARSQWSNQHFQTAALLNDLARLYLLQARYAEAEPLARRSFAIRESLFGRSEEVVASLCVLANVYAYQGRYAEAEPLLQQALEIRHELLGDSSSPRMLAVLNDLASLYWIQRRFAEAEPLNRRILAIIEATYRPNDRKVAAALNNLGNLLRERGSYSEAEPLYERALEISRSLHEPDHPEIARRMVNLADLRTLQGRYAEARDLYQQALPIIEESYGDNHPLVCKLLGQLAELHFLQKQFARARPLIDRAIAAANAGGASPDKRRWSHTLRASIAWEQGDRETALADLEQAMRMAELQHAWSSGGELERAETFGAALSPFELTIAYQVRLNNVAAAHRAAERSTARSLIDLLERQGVDLLADLPPSEADRLRNREVAARNQVARLEFEMRMFQGEARPPDTQRQRPRQELLVELAAAREEAQAAYRDLCNASTAVRRAVGQPFEPVGLDQLQQWVDKQQALLLQYYFGERGSWLFMIAAGTQPRALSLTLEAAQAQALEVEPGFVDAEKRTAIFSLQGQHVQAQLTEASIAPSTINRLHALWNWLIPAECREALRDGRYRYLAVVPAGPLSLVPLDVLVVTPGDAPVYLLDVGPPILYAPSASVFHQLVSTPSLVAAGPMRVLTVGGPAYQLSPVPSSQLSPSPDEVLAMQGPRDRYTALGGRLTPLPHTLLETTWVADRFAQHAADVEQLTGRNATEANVRRTLPGRHVVHLACHGLTDQMHGNLFGALALTPGAAEPVDPDNDGFLTLREIYDLDLQSGELAILSACQTNYGPQQQGEGVWALSRGFLVAGSRRVVASNWVVDDEATANLVGNFCRLLVESKPAASAVDHALALRDAKQAVRRQRNWTEPFYWGGFVLVGPP